MREIKFRVWDNVLKYYLESKSTLLIDITDGTIYDSQKDDYINDVTVEQFTGLKDKNGVDIYEGDVVIERLKGFDDRKSVVELDTVNPCFVLKRIDKKWNFTDYEYDFVKCNLMKLEVIGNIHQ